MATLGPASDSDAAIGEFARRVLLDNVKVSVALRKSVEPHDVGWLEHRAI